MKRYVFLILFSLFFFHNSSAWSQIIWTKCEKNPVLVAGRSGQWDDSGVIEPAVIFDGSHYHMWYTGADALSEPSLCIGYAMSKDGISWEKFEKNPVLEPGPAGNWDDVRIRTGCVLYEKEEFKMWYAGYDGRYYRIGYATSSDGIEWSTDPEPVLEVGTSGQWDARFVTAPAVLHDEAGYHMWYAGSAEGTVNDMKIGYASSPDGIHWTKYDRNPVFVPDEPWAKTSVTTPHVIFRNDKFHMWYGGHSGAGSNWGTGYAVSEDGINWSKFYKNPVLLHSNSGNWDDKESWGSRISFNEMDNQFQLWYHGSSFNSDDTYAVGYATAPVNILIPGEVSTIQGGIDMAREGDVVLVAAGHYYENINFKGKTITVASYFLLDGDTAHISNTIIDGSQPSDPDSGSVVLIISGEKSGTTLSGFTITGGTGTLFDFATYGKVHVGGGIVVDSSNCRILNNKIVNNCLHSQGYDCAGGGVEINYSDCIMENNIITNNSIYTSNNWAGGGGIDLNGNSIILRNNIVSDNKINSNWGPGAGISVYLWTESDTICIENNVIQHNIYNSYQLAAGGGMGILYCKGEVIVCGNIISRNESHGSLSHLYGEAGGIYIENCSPVISNNLIYDNRAGYGGGISVCYYTGFEPQSTEPLILNNTITGNEARVAGAVYTYGMFAHPLIMNCISWNNHASNSHDEIYRRSGNITVVYSDIAGGYHGLKNISEDPGMSGEFFELADSSNCIGSGISTYKFGSKLVGCPSSCLMGCQRPTPVGSNPDIGACESLLGSPVVGPVGGVNQQLANNLPETYELKQNYPNPFNPTTTIAFDLPEATQVTLKIFNILGEEVETLLSEFLLSGSYEYQWDAGNLASGVYLYKLEAEGFLETKKMILMR
ncbi:MAG: T9SS type A sorting domain-containing protein [Calditrichaeota bacterium]|nr:T9SS type A sorting domain-containing protein [Calditrichota bacterium]